MHPALPMFVLVSLLMLPLPALAYLGPVLGLGVIGSMIAIVVVVFLSAFSFIFLPVRNWFDRLRKGRGEDKEEQDRDP